MSAARRCVAIPSHNFQFSTVDFYVASGFPTLEHRNQAGGQRRHPGVDIASQASCDLSAGGGRAQRAAEARAQDRRQE